MHVAHRLGWGVLASCAMALAAWKVRSLTIGGAAVSAVMGAAIFSLGGFEAWLMYLAAATVALTSWRVGQKRRGPASPKHGVGTAIASCAIAVIGSVLMAAIDDNRLGVVILTSALAAWASDAMAAEFGKGYGKVAGAIAGVMTAVILAGLFALAFEPLRLVAPFIGLGAVAGLLAARALSRKDGGNSLLNEDVVLFLNTLVAAAVAAGTMLLATAS